MSKQTVDDRFEVIELALEVANDVVAFDSHLVLLEHDPKQGQPRATWHYDIGPSFKGAEHDREIRGLLKLMSIFKSNRDVQKVGLFKQRKCIYIVKMVYKRDTKGILSVARDSPGKFSATDVRLLKSVGVLAATAMYESQAFNLLRGLHLHFLDHRTSTYQAQDVKSVAEQYIEKIEHVFHPEVLQLVVTRPLPAIKVRSSIKLVTENGMALYIAACRSTTARAKLAKDWSTKRLAARYDADGKSTITARVFASQIPYLTNKYLSLSSKKAVKRLFHDVESHMSVPIVAGTDPPLGVLTVETTVKANYTPVHLHALALLAGHAARPLGRAQDRELSFGRLADLDVIRDMMGSLQRCKNWSEIKSVLSKDLKRLRYHRGLICEVLYGKKLVVGSHYWGLNMKELCRKTRRHFIRNRNDCQIKAVIEKIPQAVSHPKQDPAAHREAVKVAALGPFVIIPMLDSTAKVAWTLHVEREDTAPIGIPEIANLQEICRAAVAARERLHNVDRQQEAADIALAWAQRLQEHFWRHEEVLQNLADFAIKYMCSRCIVYQFDDNKMVGICQAGLKLGGNKEFLGFKFSRSVARLRSVLCRESRPIIIRQATRQKKLRYRKEFRVEFVQSMFYNKDFAEEDVPEKIVVPLFAHGMLMNIVAFDKKGLGYNPDDRTFTTDEIHLFGTIGRLTSLALERACFAQQMLRQASVGASMGVFRHEIAGCFRRLSDQIVLSRNVPTESKQMIDNLLKTVTQEMNKTEVLREFFTNEVFKEKFTGVKHTPVSREIKLALKMIGLTHSKLVQHPKRSIKVRVVQNQHPLCLILLQLLTNAREAIKRKKAGLIKIGFKSGRQGAPHILTVSDTGIGVSKIIARELQRSPSTIWRPPHGLGLQCAQLLAQGQGWTLRLARRKSPTRFEISIPK